jgi:hypothetical protein
MRAVLLAAIVLTVAACGRYDTVSGRWVLGPPVSAPAVHCALPTFEAPVPDGPIVSWPSVPGCGLPGWTL